MLFCLCSLFAVSLASTKIFVLFGPSQAGKSSFINALSRQSDLAQEGNGSGISQTAVCQEYVIERDGQQIAILDVPGLDDNFMNISDEAIMDEIRQKVMDYLAVMALETGEERMTIDGIILFESLLPDASTLKRTMLKACMLFGDDFGKSSMVVFTMGDLACARFPEPCPEGIMGCCEWQSQGVDQQKMDANWAIMKRILWSLDPYPITHMEQILEEIRVLAQDQCNGQETKYKTVKIPKKKLVTRVVGTGRYGQRQTGEQPVSIGWFRVQMEFRHQHGTSIAYDLSTLSNFTDSLKESLCSLYNRYGVYIDWRTSLYDIVTQESVVQSLRLEIGGSKIVQRHTGPTDLNQIPGLNNAVIAHMTPFLPILRHPSQIQHYEITTTVADEVDDGMQDVQVQEPPRPVSEFTEDARNIKLEAIRSGLLQ